MTNIAGQTKRLPRDGVHLQQFTSTFHQIQALNFQKTFATNDKKHSKIHEEYKKQRVSNNHIARDSSYFHYKDLQFIFQPK